VSSYGIHWFRRDLRIEGNPALLWNHERHEGRVLGVFFFDSVFLSRKDFSHNRFAFFIDTLEALRQDLRKAGGDLLVVDSVPEKGFPDLLKGVSKSKLGGPDTVSFNRDYEPFARERDQKLEAILTGLGVAVHAERDHLLIEPDELSKPDGGFYQIYTPFSKRWFALLAQKDVQARIAASVKPAPRFKLTWTHPPLEDSLDDFKARNKKRVSIPIPKAGTEAAWKALDAFRPKLGVYETQRDLPAVAGTSHFSLFFKNGSLSPAQVISALKLNRSNSRFMKELVWREFYYHILWHCPNVEYESFNPKYRAIDWPNQTELFDAWKAGKTGYPIVDAAMRQLAETGWMHNRARMIVASFLTKDLLIDWRWGERYFMEALLDGDLAANNGGWQWAASTGCDPQPYFRVFNPTLQSQKFDPEGVYIKRWVPERAKLKGKALHEPIDPIVGHAYQKVRALSLYKGAK
jgi:deoxyribodipyrimidine photo-lyase